eukprot:NODE_302_length_11399_cov_0.339115.p10 type:complete len:125 gc:universal NODE_302_length_11399_cov_0.339115:10692-11066(+)
MHPLSKLTRRVTKKYTHDQRIKKVKKESKSKFIPIRIKLNFFKKFDIASKAKVRLHVESYLKYIEEENFFFAPLERKCYEGGYFEVPDLTIKNNVELLQKWNGNKSHTIKFVKVGRIQEAEDML